MLCRLACIRIVLITASCCLIRAEVQRSRSLCDESREFRASRNEEASRMAMNRIQFQPGLSLTGFLQPYGSSCVTSTIE